MRAAVESFRRDLALDGSELVISGGDAPLLFRVSGAPEPYFHDVCGDACFG